MSSRSACANPLLKGVRVLDLSRLLPGPFATLYLAQLGAEVIKVEEPRGGDYARQMPELFELVNRGKKSVTLDLRIDADRECFKRLAADCEVLVESFRPGVMERLGCGYDTLRAVNPRLVYAALSGYGQSGPYCDRPGHDMNYRGYAGELAQTGGRDAPPSAGNFQVADLAGGALTCLIGILAAVIGARASGRGTFVDAAMLDGTLALQVAALADLRALGRAPAPGHGLLSGAMPNYSIYRCKDGRHLALGAFERKFFVRFCELAGRPELLDLPDTPGATSEPLRQALADLVATRTRDEWEALLADHDTCASAILELNEALADTHVRARGMLEGSADKPAFACPLVFDRLRPPALAPAPELGAHNAELLAGLEPPAAR